MKRVLIAVLLALPGLALGTYRTVQAAGTPSIAIVTPPSGATLHGSTLTVTVTVMNFRLVKPVWVNPPILKDGAGAIAYQLDGQSNFVPARDITAATTHTWTGVRPGRHTVTVYLVTSQHAPFPTAQPASITVSVVASPPAGGGSPGVGQGPTTGGAADIAKNPINGSLLLVALAALFLGFFVLVRRKQLTPRGARIAPDVMSSRPPPTPEPISLPTVAASVPPAGEDTPPHSMESATVENAPVENVQPEAEPEAAPSASEPAVSEPEAQVDVPAPFPPAGSGLTDEAKPEVTPQVSPPPAPIPIWDRSPNQGSHGNAVPDLVRERALEMAHQWSQVVESLVQQLDQQEAERRHMLEHIHGLEERLQASRSLREDMRELSSAFLAPEDLQAVRYVTESLLRDPDHIVVLAAVAQHAAKLHDLVENYVRIREAVARIEGTPAESTEAQG